MAMDRDQPHRAGRAAAGEDREIHRWLEANERWAYGDRAGVQRLRRLICLCSDCHEATHFGLAQLSGRAAEAFAHLRVVAGLTEDQALAHVDAAFTLWQQRSARAWALDLTVLTGAGITLVPPPSPSGRALTAELALHDR